MRHLILQVREGLLNWRKGCVQELFVLSAINAFQWTGLHMIDHDCTWVEENSVLIHFRVCKVCCGDHQLSIWNTYILLLLNTKSIWLSHTCCTKANPDLNPLFEMLQSIQRLGTFSIWENAVPVMRIKLSTLSSSFMSCQRFQDFRRPPVSPPMQKPTNHPQHPRFPTFALSSRRTAARKPSGNLRKLQKLPFRKHTTRWISQTGNKQQNFEVSFTKVCPSCEGSFSEMLHLWKKSRMLLLWDQTMRGKTEKLWVVTMFSTSMTLGTLQPCQELLGDTSTSDASQPKRTQKWCKTIDEKGLKVAIPNHDCHVSWLPWLYSDFWMAKMCKNGCLLNGSDPKSGGFPLFPVLLGSNGPCMWHHFARWPTKPNLESTFILVV